MKIVIDIPDNMQEMCQWHKDGICSLTGIEIDIIAETIVKGTVLSKGHWIQQPRCEGDEQPDLVCPNCGFKISWWDMGNFCAKCGKELEGGAE